jgi:cation diffusion facilitator family transporter
MPTHASTPPADSPSGDTPKPAPALDASLPATILSVRKRAALISAAIGVMMLVLKMGAYLLTGSSAILSDAMESVVHVAATGFALFSVILSSRPPDRTHPYGHGKVEYFSAGFEGALIILAAVAILYTAGLQLLKGAELTSLDVGAVIIGFAGVVNLFLGTYLVRVGRRTKSLTLEADGRHVLTDSVTSLGVLAGLLLVMITGWTPLDPLVAIAVALNIIFTGGRLVLRSVSGLMDAADPDQLRDVIAALVQRRRAGWIDLHRLRITRRGDAHHVDLHVTIPRFWDVGKAHEEQEELRAVIATALPGPTGLLAHLDPCVDACCEFCDYEPCKIRAAACGDLRTWDLARATAPADYLREGDPPD